MIEVEINDPNDGVEAEFGSSNITVVAVNPKGTWDNEETYVKGDIVYNAGISYIAKKAVPAGTPTSNTEYWQIVADVPTDTTLTQTGEAADAKAVGDALGALSNHSALSGRDSANQHPISAITGLTDALAETEAFIRDETAFADAINNPQQKTYYLGEFTITNTISIASSRGAKDLTFVGGKITLNAYLFTNPTLAPGYSASWALPNFIGTVFEKGTHDTMLADGFYPVSTAFTHCTFSNIAMLAASKCIQSLKFTSCVFVGGANTPIFINTNAVYAVKFISCDFNDDSPPILINVANDDGWYTEGGDAANIGCTTSNLAFITCKAQNRAKPLVRKTQQGDVAFYGLYTENNTSPLVVIYRDEENLGYRHSTTFVNCRLQSMAGYESVPIVAITHPISSNLPLCQFICIGCRISDCILVNTNRFRKYIVEGCNVLEGATVYPYATLSQASYDDTSADSYSGGTWTNGLAAFTKSGNTIKVKASSVVLLTFQSTSGTHLVFAGKTNASLSNTPFAYCLDDPTLTITSAWDSDSNIITLTLPQDDNINSSYHLSAIDLQGLTMSVLKTEAYRGQSADGFAPSDYGAISTTYTE